MSISRTHTWLAVAVLFVVAMAAAEIFMFLYLDHLGTRLKDTLQTIASEAALEADQQRVASTLASSSAKRTELVDYVLVGDTGVVSFLSMLDENAAALGVDLETTNLKLVAGEDSFDQLQVDLSLAGSEASVRTFFELLETLPYASMITRLTLVRGDDGVSSNVSLAISVTDYDQ